MYASEIDRMLKDNDKTRPIYRGIYAMNQLSKKTVKDYGVYVINLTHLPKMTGHWVNIYVSPENDNHEYFDPYGVSPPLELIQRINISFPVFNNKTIQSPLSTICGNYSLLFTYFKSLNYSLFDIKKKFGKDLLLNDIKTIHFCKRHFNFSSPFMDKSYVFSLLNQKG